MNARTRTTLPALVAGALLMAGCAGSAVQEEAGTASARDGARIWSATCNNCHNLRQGTEYSAEEWPVIVKHMRTRAGLTKSKAEAVAAFLQNVAENAQGS